MTPEQIKLVKAAWVELLPVKDKAAEIFYAKLFELDPSVRPLFKGNIGDQGRKLMMAINTVVNSLDRIEGLAPIIQDMGRRHAGYGVKAAHYDTVGAALLWTLAAGLGPAFTPEVKAAWADAYALLATVMKEAAETATT